MIIREIKLLTSRFEALRSFYLDVLGFTLDRSDERSFTVVAGASKLTFAACEPDTEPYYHFAFNITESKIEPAIAWLAAKGILPSIVDQSPVVYSQSWQSHSVYFGDPAGNIVEFIARHRKPSESKADFFSLDDVLNVSEIGLPANDVDELSRFLRSELAEAVYIEGNAMFTPIGDEDGLLILSSLERCWLGSDKKVAIYPVEVALGNGGRRSVPVLHYPYVILTE